MTVESTPEWLLREAADEFNDFIGSLELYADPEYLPFGMSAKRVAVTCAARALLDAMVAAELIVEL